MKLKRSFHSEYFNLSSKLFLFELTSSLREMASHGKALFSELAGHQRDPAKAKAVKVLEALTEVIHEKKRAAGAAAAPGVLPSPTEYFATILTGLESADDRSTLQELVFLLSLALPHVPTPVLRAKFDLVGGLFQEVARAANGLADGSTLLRHTVAAVGTLCLSQTPTAAAWGRRRRWCWPARRARRSSPRCWSATRPRCSSPRRAW